MNAEIGLARLDRAVDLPPLEEIAFEQACPLVEAIGRGRASRKHEDVDPLSEQEADDFRSYEAGPACDECPNRRPLTPE